MGVTIPASAVDLHDRTSQVMAVLLSMDTFILDLQTSVLCDERQYEHLDDDALTKFYDDIIAGLLEKQVPVRQVTCRRRSSNVWFDDECRRAISGRLDQWRAVLVAPVRCLMSTHRLPWRGASRDVNTSPCYSGSVLISGRTA